ncbi:methenyl tetrahydrofolate cyclohydrolase [Desulfosporosinus orientis DSM 765]|uniref:Methenyl tetrahydrofolate cyclohydrolase n=1 Tax=Desulfosporosinus orientis (strain ATCC 19365 / DSM 765 / NCIMB 8382 / VKM B-1628 / Singapore I) TaxID=768706 RepID=G7WJH0_DESOD|nr:cyclodeaminase/cyclohydrolase family protein [Desulfosporosinus orientis]AET70407.1 methenyl tetrahydrofolate cyclohydrolase [Desulfosporosinus orientis DSM 765]
MLIDKTVTGFIEELASNSPAPGGGSAAALAGSLGAALTTMVCNFTEGKPKFSDVQDEIVQIKGKGLTLKSDLVKYIDEDTNAFNEVMKAYKLPKESDEEKAIRSEKIQEANKQASLLPLKVAEACVEVLKLSIRVLTIGNPNTACDAAVSGVTAYAGFQGAIFNVKINLSSIKDEAFLHMIKDRVGELQVDADQLNQQILERAKEVIG